MSRIGNSPIKLPPKVEVTLTAGEISVKGPLGSLSQRFSESIAIEKNVDDAIKHIEALETVRGKIVRIRLEELA